MIAKTWNHFIRHLKYNNCIKRTLHKFNICPHIFPMHMQTLHLIFSAFCVAGSRLWLDRTYWSSKLKNNWSLTFCSEELKEVHGPCTPSHAYNVATFYWIKLQGFKEGIHFHIRNLESLRPIGSCNTWGDHLLLSCKNSVPIQEFQIYD